MTNEQILQKAIEKAVKNGWDKHENWGEIEAITPDYDCHSVWIKYEADDAECINTKELIYSHEFAKAFFGEEPCEEYQDTYWTAFSDDDTACPKFEGPQWVYHLQQMVVSEDPIRYLESYL